LAALVACAVASLTHCAISWLHVAADPTSCPISRLLCTLSSVLSPLMVISTGVYVFPYSSGADSFRWFPSSAVDLEKYSLISSSLLWQNVSAQQWLFVAPPIP
jgi:hypothetical protein